MRPRERIQGIASDLGVLLRRRFAREEVLADPALGPLHRRLEALAPKELARHPVAAARYVVMDTETTGLRVYGGDEIISIALLEMQGLTFTGRELVTLVDPGRPIPPESTAIHGLADGDVRGAPTLGDLLTAVVEFIGDGVLVGHHVHFDVRFLNKVLQRRALTRLRHPWLDTMLLYTAHSGRMGHYTLEEVTHACRVTVHERHTARGDALATGLVFAYLAGRMSGPATTVAELASRQHEVGYF